MASIVYVPSGKPGGGVSVIISPFPESLALDLSGLLNRSLEKRKWLVCLTTVPTQLPNCVIASEENVKLLVAQCEAINSLMSAIEGVCNPLIP